MSEQNEARFYCRKLQNRKQKEKSSTVIHAGKGVLCKLQVRLWERGTASVLLSVCRNWEDSLSLSK